MRAEGGEGRERENGGRGHNLLSYYRFTKEPRLKNGVPK